MDKKTSKIAFVLEGGAMRGLYSAGVLDVFLKNNIKTDAIYGVSAGALFGINYKSRQLGGPKEFDKATIEKLYEIRRKMGLPGKHPANLCAEINKDNPAGCKGCHSCAILGYLLAMLFSFFV